MLPLAGSHGINREVTWVRLLGSLTLRISTWSTIVFWTSIDLDRSYVSINCLMRLKHVGNHLNSAFRAMQAHFSHLGASLRTLRLQNVTVLTEVISIEHLELYG